MHEPLSKSCITLHGFTHHESRITVFRRRELEIGRVRSGGAGIGQETLQRRSANSLWAAARLVRVGRVEGLRLVHLGVAIPTAAALRLRRAAPVKRVARI